MARGKHSASAAKQRLEASNDHIDRLTEQLVEAKLRARKYEDAAGREEMHLAEIARLRQQVADQTSPELDRLRAATDQMLADAADRFARLKALLATVLENAGDAPVFWDAGITEMRALGVADIVPNNRASRRNLERPHKRTAGDEDYVFQDNRRSLAANMERAIVRKGHVVTPAIDILKIGAEAMEQEAALEAVEP